MEHIKFVVFLLDLHLTKSVDIYIYIRVYDLSHINEQIWRQILVARRCECRFLYEILAKATDGFILPKPTDVSDIETCEVTRPASSFPLRQ
jgi:hypothetical protein